MNCYQHPDTTATAFCRDCGRALCAACQITSNGTIFCQEHATVSAASNTPAKTAVALGSNPYQQTVTPAHTSPGLAFWLGLIPGVGAIYNGQYAKGIVHAGILGILISLADSISGGPGEPFIAMMLVGFWAYMAFEAFHTAKKRQAGLPVDEFSSLISPSVYATRTPIGPLVLIALGVLFLLDTLHVIAFRDLARFWPVLLIVAGGLMLNNRVSSLRRTERLEESTHEQ
jgi:hypothetical protein